MGGLSWQEFSGSRNTAELNKLLQPVMCRRLKKDVLTQLPAKRRQQIPVELPKEAYPPFSDACVCMYMFV